MPELPEIETIRRGLKKSLIGERILHVKVLYPGIIVPKGRSLEKLLHNDRFTSVGRHGKYLLLTTEHGTRLVVHLRMTGQLLLTDRTYSPDKHVHLMVTLPKGRQLIYRDTRKFGRWTIVAPEKQFMDYINAGTDALTIDIKELRQLINRHPQRKLKAFLLDQPLIAGIGNIYADEICYVLKLDPETPIKKVNITKLHTMINVILKLAIKHKGTSVSDYLTSRNAKGKFQNKLNVYAQDTCRNCGTKIIRKKVAGRTSHVCPHCQKSHL